MKRKIISQGGGGYTIYLPKKWVEKKGLKPGDEINVKEVDTQLTIGSAVKEKKHCTIEIGPENKKDMRNILTHLYRNGFDSITLKSIDNALLENIKKYTSDLLLGFELTEIKESSCIIENISEPSGEKYDVMLRRIFLIIKETQRLIIEDFRINKFQNLKSIQDLSTQQDKLILFCRRIIIKQRFESKTPELSWELLTFLMHVNHALYHMYKYASENKIIKDRKIIELLENLEDYFQLYYDAYYKKDIVCIHKLNSLRFEYEQGKCYKYLEQSKGKNNVILSHIRNIYRLIRVGTSPILAELLDKKF